MANTQSNWRNDPGRPGGDGERLPIQETVTEESGIHSMAASTALVKRQVRLIGEANTQSNWRNDPGRQDGDEERSPILETTAEE